MIDGTWIPITAELGGQPFPQEVLKIMKLTVSDGKYSVVVGETSDLGTINYFTDAEPKSIDITGTEGPNKGKTFPAIYERANDTLKICYDLAGKTRPKEFITEPNTQLFLVSYKRENSNS